MSGSTIIGRDGRGPTIILGRDGMGGMTVEEDFDRWVAFVCDRIDDACGYEVDVDVRRPRDVQSDRFIPGPGEDQDGEMLRRGLVKVWQMWVSEGPVES